VQHTKLGSKINATKISCRLKIEQIKLYTITGISYFDILTSIAEFLNCNLLIRKQKSTGNEYYTLAASSKVSLYIIIKYLEEYTLFFSKYLDYLD